MKAILDFGLPILDWMHDSQAALRANPKSKIQNPKSRRRRAVSILEVIFAILVTTIGLLAALTVFPVAAAIAKKGAVADASSIAGRSAVHDFDARGMRRPFIVPLRPGGWMAWNAAANSGNGDFQQFTPVVSPVAFSYCIDPRFMAINGTTASGVAATSFPYYNGAPGQRMVRLSLWSGLVTGTGAVALDAAAPNADPFEMSKAQADAVFTYNDDLLFERDHKRPANLFTNQDRSLPAAGVFTPTGERGTGGHYSWIATLVPKHELYATGAVVNDLYTLSIVVFFDRPLLDFSIDPAPAVTSPPDASESMYNLAERVVRVDFADAGGSGYAGGETYLIWPPVVGQTMGNSLGEFEQAKRMLKVRGGDWILLSGLAPRMVNGTPIYDVPIFRWYRVSESDHEPAYHPAPEQHFAVAVSLTGQDWDTSLANQQATIVTGVVGVYEKTVRLEADLGF